MPHNYNNGRATSYGYVLIKRPDHSRANSNGYVPEHILVWERVNGRPLPEGWCVHHYNGIKDDNRPRNLVGMPRAKHHPALDPALLKARIRELEGKLRAAGVEP